MVRSFAVVCVVAAVVCLGCNKGPDLGTVGGRVTMDGQPLPDAVVTFVPEKGGRAATGKADAQGNYTLVFIDGKGALIGKHKVSVTSGAPAQAQNVASVSSDSPEYAKSLKQAGSGSTSDVKESIPARYNTQTELVREVKPGKNVIDLELTSK